MLAGAARAQEPDSLLPWRFGKTPIVAVGGQMSLGIGAGLGFRRSALGRPYPVAAAAGLGLRYGITGSRDATLLFSAPGLADGWRLFGMARLERMLRTPYFGPANAAREVDSLAGNYGSDFYRYALVRATAFGAVQRRLRGPLWLHAAGQWRRYRASALKQTPTLYGRDAAAALLPDTLRYQDVEGRLGLVWDTREDWATPAHGVLVEGVGAAGRLTDRTRGGALGYRRLLISAREYLALAGDDRTVLALRQKLSLASASLPFVLAYEQPTAWAPTDGIFADRGIRLHGGGNQLASSHAVLSADLRHKLLLPGDDPARPVRLWGVVLADAGVLWEPGQDPSLQRRAWTLGAGVRLQFGRGFMGGFDVGITDNGPGASISGGFGY